MSRTKEYAVMSEVHDTDVGYQTLAVAVCTQAISDFMHGATEDRRSARTFILSGYFTSFSGGLDGEEVLRLLDEKKRNSRRK